MKDAPLSALELDRLEAKLRAAQALVEATAGACAAPLDALPRDAWGEALLALLDDADRLVATARRALPRAAGDLARRVRQRLDVIDGGRA